MGRRLPYAIIVSLAMTSAGLAQFDTDSHTVTVSVQEITVLSTNLGAISLSITGIGISPGQDLLNVTDQSTVLAWGTNVSNLKTTISTDLPNPQFTLKALAVNPTQGIAAPEVILSTTPTDFLTGIGRSSGTAAILYTGEASASQGSGSDIHIITLTIQSQ